MSTSTDTSASVDAIMQDLVQGQYESILEAVKKTKNLQYASILLMIANMDGYSQALKDGWGMVTLSSETIASDIANLNDDISNIKQEYQNSSDNTISKSTAKKFATDFKKYKNDVKSFQQQYEDMKAKYAAEGIPCPIDAADDANIENMFKNLNANIKAIKQTSGTDQTIGEDIKDKDYTDLVNDLNYLCAPLSSGDYPIDEWSNGSGDYEGLTNLGSDTDNLKSDGQQQVSTGETNINNMDNIAQNAVQQVSQGNAYFVKQQIPN